MTRRLTTSEFIARAQQKHGDKYDYSKAKYRGGKEKVLIGCPEHGDFSQQAGSHMRGVGCPACAGQARPTTEEWIERAKKTHGEKYDYSLVKYKNAASKVRVICPEHGVFEQSPQKHTEGNGCPTCAGLVDGTEGFIAKSIKVHGSRYDYSQAVYRGARSRVTLICRLHGPFEQLAGCHTSGKGCPECAKVLIGRKRRTTQEEFLSRAKELHSGKYSYEYAVYRTVHKNVTITCPAHGEFEQRPSVHLKGGGCPICAGRGLTDDQWISRAKETHGERYDYSETSYAGAQKKSRFICRDHGPFWQRMIEHIGGQGCPACPQKRHLPAFVYVLRSSTGISKIGVSRVIGYRLYQLGRGGQPFDCDLHYSVRCDNKFQAMRVESLAHRMLSAKNSGYKGFDGATEWFNVPPEEAVKAVDAAIEEAIAEEGFKATG